MGGSGLVTRAGASVFAYNCLIADCGETCAALTQGGEFQMYHCTFANYWSFGNRQTPTFVLDNWYLDINNQVQIRPLENTEFINCIMYGNNANQEDYSEFFVSLLPEGNPDYQFSHCLVDTEEEMDEANYTQMIDGVTPPFKDPDNHNFDLIFNDGFPDFGMDGTSVPVGNSTDIKLDIRINNEKGCYSSSVD